MEHKKSRLDRVLDLQGVPREKGEAYVRRRAQWFGMRLLKSKRQSLYKLISAGPQAQTIQDGITLEEAAEVLREILGDSSRQIQRAVK